MSRRFHRKNHQRKRDSNRINRGVRVPKQQDTIRSRLLSAAIAMRESNDIALERIADKRLEFLGLAGIPTANTNEKPAQKEEWKPPQGTLTLKQCQEVIAHVDLSGFLLKPEIIVKPYLSIVPTLYFELSIRCMVNDRDNGFPIPLYTGVLLARNSVTYDSLLISIRTVMRQMMEHEIDEFFKVDGKRPFDPHPSYTDMHGK